MLAEAVHITGMCGQQRPCLIVKQHHEQALAAHGMPGSRTMLVASGSGGWLQTGTIHRPSPTSDGW